MTSNTPGADDPRRDGVLVYEDASLSKDPACHVLAIGVAAYRSEIFKEPLVTAAISARAFLDWFADPAKAGFDNPSCQLGSAALVLSETAGAERATYAGGPVPRAIFDATKTAVRAWVSRQQPQR